MLVGPVMLLVVVPALKMVFLGDHGHHESDTPATNTPTDTPTPESP
jgi:hypothetical protein